MNKTLIVSGEPNIALQKVKIMGIGVTSFDDYEQAVDSIVRLVEGRRQTFIAAINPEKMYRAQFDSSLISSLNDAEITICDGIGVALATKILNGHRLPRITGIALFYRLIKRAEEQGFNIFLLGAAPDVNERARTILSETYPELRVVGNLDGYFDSSDDVIEKINRSRADVVFVAMGSPRQELWIRENRDRINASLLMGVGGTFDVVSGRVQWAPKIFRKTGTEWLYRLIREPKRFRRQLVLPKFVWLVILHKFGFAKTRM